MEKIQMVDLNNQYLKIKNEIDKSILDVINSSQFINGNIVKVFSNNLESYLKVKHVIPCANGTDALQIALMSLNLDPGDEIICPSFTYVATAEVISLLGLTPVMADVDPYTFNISAEKIKPLLTKKTKAIVPVHLFGQTSDMEEIINLARNENIKIIEDNAQAIGSKYTFSNGNIKFAGTIGDIGTISFFPSKNLGCFGDGGAMITDDDELASKLKMIANHGQEKKYHHKITGCNSRLDSIQAAILNIKLKYLDDYILNRNKMAKYYDEFFHDIEEINIPKRQFNSTHVFHQYTLKVNNLKRNKLKEYLLSHGIPSMVYYPIPLYKQEAFKKYVNKNFKINNIESLCQTVLSLPIHTEIENSKQEFIVNKVKDFFR
tara:strand:- start:3889 stop:5016 length:1128 start_codon:yes stop_codon:yes gene_type:complete